MWLNRKCCGGGINERRVKGLGVDHGADVARQLADEEGDLRLIRVLGRRAVRLSHSTEGLVSLLHIG